MATETLTAERILEAAEEVLRRYGPAKANVVAWRPVGDGHNDIAVLRLSMPYHDIRMPAEIGRADYAVSANIGRTLDAVRQGVIDIRCCLDWLEQQGYSRLGILGTSLGSCYSFLAAAHDPRIRVRAARRQVRL